MAAALPILAGKHVRLEPLLEAHAGELWAAADEDDIWTWMPPRPADEGALRDWIRARRAGLADGTWIPFLQRDPETGQAFGSTSMFDIDLVNRSLEIGFTWIGRTHRRTGANTEAKRLLLSYAFETMGMNRVQLKTDARNVRSQRAMARIGATREGVLRAHRVLPDGFVRDSAVFSVVRGEWDAVKSHQARLLKPRD